MPGYVMHLAIAEEYVKKHNDITSYDDFIRGVIYPDSVKDKSTTHYGANSSCSNLIEFLNEHRKMNDYEKGFFIHLVSDYIFYKNLDELPSKKIYDDYDILNDEIIKKYGVKLPKELGSIINSKEGKLTYLSSKFVDNYVENVSNMSIDEYVKDIKENPKNWLIFKTNKDVD